MEKQEEFLSLEWFKNRVEKSIDKSIARYVDKMIDKEVVVRPYHSVKLINDSLIVAMHNGEILTKPNATVDDFNLIKRALSREEILNVIEDKVVIKEAIKDRKEADKMVFLAEGFQLLSGLKDFVVKENHIYLKGTNRTIPSLLIDRFAEVVGRYSKLEKKCDVEEALLNDDEYQGLKNFFMWCCLNPRAEVADSLYDFLHKNGMKITKQGFFVALRNVVKAHDSKDDAIVKFVTNAYNKVKAVWKKSPSNYFVIEKEDGSYSLKEGQETMSSGTIVGNLTSLYLELPNMVQNRYTDNWTRTFDIRIGQVVNMPKEKANWSTQDCATAGLHFAGHTAPYVLCGDTTVFTLHNPMKVVGIGREKGRCWEYLPFMTTTVKEANAIMNSEDFDFMQLDEEYAIKELEGLVERAKEGFTAESNKYEFNLPSISTDEIRSIVSSLEKMRESIIKRVSIID